MGTTEWEAVTDLLWSRRSETSKWGGAVRVSTMRRGGRWTATVATDESKVQVTQVADGLRVKQARGVAGHLAVGATVTGAEAAEAVAAIFDEAQ